MLDILGWQFDRAGPKSDDFSENVSALGVRFDLSESGMGSLKVHNTEKKVEDTTLLLENVVQADKLAKKDALVLRGKLAFCDAFIFGRVGKLALQDITKHAYASPFISKFSERLVVSLILLRSRLLTGQPRLLTCEMLDTFFFIFMMPASAKKMVVALVPFWLRRMEELYHGSAFVLMPRGLRIGSSKGARTLYESLKLSQLRLPYNFGEKLFPHHRSWSTLTMRVPSSL